MFLERREEARWTARPIKSSRGWRASISTTGPNGIRSWPQAWATTGNHVIEVRATDKTGYTQTSVQEQPEPNGASGYPSVSVTVG